MSVCKGLRSGWGANDGKAGLSRDVGTNLKGRRELRQSLEGIGKSKMVSFFLSFSLHFHFKYFSPLFFWTRKLCLSL